VDCGAVIFSKMPSSKVPATWALLSAEVVRRISRLVVEPERLSSAISSFAGSLSTVPSREASAGELAPAGAGPVGVVAGPPVVVLGALAAAPDETVTVLVPPPPQAEASDT